MTNTNISVLGIQQTTNAQLLQQTSSIEKLNEQLSSGKLNNNLTDYDPTTAKNLINYNNLITQRQSYITSITNVQARLSVYDSTMTNLEAVATGAQTLAASNSTYDPTKLSALKSQVISYMKQVQDDLNQQVDGRYIYSGTRYNTQPVTDISAQSTTVSYPFTPSSSPDLASYDTATVAGNPTSAAGFTQDSVTVDAGYNVQYGVTSNDPAFQKLVAGLQLFSQATQDVNATSYTTDIQNASALLSDALTSIQSLHTGVASNINTLQQETSLQNTDITNIQNQIYNLSSANATTVSTEITSLQAQLDASYSTTGKILKLSLVNYL